MKTHPRHKAAAGRPPSAQQVAFELKSRVVLSLNKLADRDTQQIGADELNRAAAGLTPETIAPFLSCVADTDSDQKTAVRKECVRAMGTLARFHGPILSPHLGKMVGSIVKRLKDADSVVRDACVEAVGVMAMNVRGAGGGGDDGAGFVVLARPLFEALGEQNRYVQAGSALCLARVIDQAVDPPGSIFPQMLSRVVKLLKNPHFMAKPAVVELIRSIIQAGCGSIEQTLPSAVTAILEALKSNDWTTRKAAALALSDIAASAGPLLGKFKVSCLQYLEACRFDKVKPVRDAILHAIQCWKTLPGTHSPGPSEAGSCTKENLGGESSGVISASDGGWRETCFSKAGPVFSLSCSSVNSIKRRTPPTVRRSPSYVQTHQQVKSDDWHIEIAVPKTRTTPSVDSQNEVYGRRCTKMVFERTTGTNKEQTVKYDYESVDDKAEFSSMSDLVSGSFETKHATNGNGCLEERESTNFKCRNFMSATEEIAPQDLRSQDRKSLDSTLTESCCRGMPECCLHAANEFTFIRKQLSEIETRQSNLMDILQAFVGYSMDGMSTLQLKMHNLELTVDKIAQGITQKENYSSIPGSKLLKRNHSVSSSPRLSASTPRSSVDANYRQPSLLSTKNREMIENASLWSRSSTSNKDRLEIQRDPASSLIRNHIPNSVQKNSTQSIKSSGSTQTRMPDDLVSSSACHVSSKKGSMESKASLWKRIKDCLYAGDFESAYAEVLCSSDDLSLIELMDTTGPVLEKLSHDTASEILSLFASHFLNHRLFDSIIPWLQQVADLSSGDERMNYYLSAKERMRFLLAIENVAAMEFNGPEDRISITELARKLRKIWGDEPSCRIPLPTRGTRLRQNAVS